MSDQPCPAPAPTPTAAADGSEASDIPIGLFRDCVALRDWLLSEGARLPESGDLLAGMAERLNALGVPVDRATTAIDALHSDYSGVGRFWTREDGVSFRLFPHGEVTEQALARSPFAHVYGTGEWLILDLRETPDDRYSIIPELKAAGYTHYITVPLFFTNGTKNGVTFATRDPRGFGDDDLAILRFIIPTLSAVMEMRGLNARLDHVLRVYVGDGPHQAILAGFIRRGQVERIRSAILFADMRGYTHLTDALTPEASVELLNTYFDCLVPPIESEGGEVLKYMGDGLLAIFRESGDDLGGAAQGALSAAQAALRRVDEANRAGRFPTRIEIGIALHHGEAAYGNVGSGARLDFTVIGRDVNLASRLAKLNKVLSEPLLMSKPFVDFLWGDPELLGTHPLDGIAEEMAIYRPGKGG
ncbi:adenylate/guanylate cyclase domain-containing protein [Methylobacterium aquaticum]|uniref:adenylate/guanylate cyclase domain-containing protein n=1 Tax=Methylobacterium aquaticum TaxID=270351 RepID=UPI0019340F7C|nr:adenylate/guanylate cyclase domain-containing protein [Methylobacterium aquaticum]QRE72324.1 adenylate/guanylate cyclase domain-containing protein [Methylobacterium aquaticum]